MTQISPSRTPRLRVTEAALGAFLCAVALDIVASVAQFETWAVHAFRGATLMFVVGIALATYATLVGRVESARQVPMLIVTIAAAGDLALRASSMWTASHPSGTILLVSIAVANLVALGALFDGTPGDQEIVHVRSGSRASAAHRREKRLVLPRADELWARWQVDMTHRTN